MLGVQKEPTTAIPRLHSNGRGVHSSGLLFVRLLLIQSKGDSKVQIANCPRLPVHLVAILQRVRLSYDA